MFTEEGIKALVTYVMILILAEFIGWGADQLFGWDQVAKYIIAFFLLTFLVRTEQLKATVANHNAWKNRLRDNLNRADRTRYHEN